MFAFTLPDMNAKDATKALREAAGLSQEKLAKRLEVSRVRVCQVEGGGHRFGPTTILLIARRFRREMSVAGVTPLDFMRIE